MKRWTNGLPGATKRLGANLALRGLSVSQSGCARIPMMARSKIAPLQRPNTLMQLSRSSVLELPLATRGRAIHLLARFRRADERRKGPLLGVNRTKSPRARIDEIDPYVWSGRASQEVFVDLADLRSCINVSGL